MTLKDVIESDVDSVFANEEEFWDEHEVDGETILCMVDKDCIPSTNSQVEGTFSKQKALYVKESSLKRKIVKESVVCLDGEYYSVTDVSLEVGIYVFTLEADES